MIAVRIKYVQKHRGRDGRVRYYFRHPRLPRVSLPDLHSDDFWPAYQKALAQDAVKEERIQRGLGSFSVLCESWLHSTHFIGLKPSTQKAYRNITRCMQMEDFADHQVDRFETQHIRAFAGRKSKTPAAFNNWLKVFGLIFQHGVDRGDIERNPATGIPRMKEKGIGAKSWEDAEIAKYENYWPSGSMARLALYLLLYTGQRRSDVVRMGWSDIQAGGLLSVQQMKTGTQLLIPLHPALAAEIERLPKTQPTFLVTEEGKSFTVDGFYHRIVKWVTMCGIKERLSPHGLRKAAARRMAEAGCTPHQIASITGHKTLSEIERYTRAVDQSRLARDAVLKIGLKSFTKS